MERKKEKERGDYKFKAPSEIARELSEAANVAMPAEHGNRLAR